MKKMITICIIAVTVAACNNQAKHDAEILKAQQKVVDSIVKVESIKKQVVDSMKQVATENKKQEKVVEVRTVPSNEVITTTTTTRKKKGWSSTAKGAVIGAGVGAITGAMIDKKKGEGAVVGGLIGAAVGAGTGAIIDGKKKN